jgi:L(+)-tartrate dehydratase alpha subunit
LDIAAEALSEAVRRATLSVPLRPNAVNFFDERNTNDNTAERIPWINWEIVPASDEMEITVFFFFF